jgi:cystathionine beta-lyase
MLTQNTLTGIVVKDNTSESHMPNSASSLSDDLVQMGRPDRIKGRHVNLPLELGSTIVFDTLAEFEAARDARYDTGTMFYGRYGNAATFKLETMLARLEKADAVTLTSSGVAAITMTLLTFARPNTHLLVADHVYSNTRGFCETVLKRMGIEIEYFDPMIGAGINDLLRDTTCTVMFEVLGSGTFEVPDIPAIAKAARAAGVPSILDGTWATPVFCQPITLGVDVVVASMSKYLSGHSDCMMGMIASTQKYAEDIRKTTMAIGDKTGGQEVFLALRGLRTLKMRMEYFDKVGRDMAQWLKEHPQVKSVLHPAFENCPGHANWARDFSGASGLFSVVFHPCSDDQIRDFVDALHHFGIGVSWGGFESLVLPVTPQRSAGTWTDSGQLVRFNIGLEDLDTLKADLLAALPHLNTASE